MKLTKDEFEELKSEWYKKLEETGFIDIEYERPPQPSEQAFMVYGDGKRHLIQTETACMRRWLSLNSLKRTTSEEYFRTLSQVAMDENTSYRNSTDRHILQRYSEGAKIVVIMQELEERGTSRRRNSIRFIIRRYEFIWGIRSWTKKQLNHYQRRK